MHAVSQFVLQQLVDNLMPLHEPQLLERVAHNHESEMRLSLVEILHCGVAGMPG